MERKMKITVLSLFCLPASTLLIAAVQSAPPVSPANPAAANCQAQAEQFLTMGVTPASLADYKKTHASKNFVEVDFLKIGPNSIPMFTMPRLGRSPGPDDATLIVLLHNQAGATSDTPVVDAICHDQNHSFAIDKDKDSITFATDDYERLYLLFRLDPATLSHTEWVAPPDSVEMVPIVSPSNPKPTGTQRWCDDGKHKDVGVKGTDMWFTMCKNFGATRYYKYTLYFTVSGKPVSLDPIIVHEPQ
jgi:hypothetical protein